ncbi:MAG: hypothetical protein RH862_15580 [Leptospiraceae bacterium]
MHSSTSVSNSVSNSVSENDYTLVVPARRSLGRIALITLGLSLTILAGWEIFVRLQGYEASLQDGHDLWASVRSEVSKNPESTVLIGGSRMLFDFNLDAYEKLTGTRPIQLATVGTNATDYLEDLANEESWKGTVIIGITPSLWFAPPGSPPVANARKSLDHYRSWAPSERIGHRLDRLLQSFVAFLNEDDLTLKKMLERLPIENRQNAAIGPPLPPYMHTVDADRQGRLWPRVEEDETLRARISSGWMALFTPPPPPPGVTPDQARQQFIKHVQAHVNRTAALVGKIQDRGGKVIFVRFPSTGPLRELESKFTPRPFFWDPMIQISGAPGIHFEDYAQLQGFDCPEGSHLSAEGAREFTERLTPLLQKKLSGR